MNDSTQITLEPYTLERCHAFWRGYTADPAMWDGSYQYDEQAIDAYYRAKVSLPDRVFFAVCLCGEAIGEIQLKRIDRAGKHATLSVHLADDRYKNRGFGTQAIRRIADFAFAELGLETVYADAVHRNARSRHVLEKLGFVYLREDDVLCYFMLRKPLPGGGPTG